MSLKEKLSKDLSASMKSRDSARVKVLRFVQAAIKNKEIALRPDPINEEHILGVLKKQIKQIQESLEHYKKAGYTDQVSHEEFQLSVIDSYLPKSLSEEELSRIVKDVISDLKAESIKDMGQVMKATMAKTKGAADGKLLSQIVRKELDNA